jgi:uncharacterized protein (DUF736 family)
MAFETREGQGALFVNDRKEKDDQPDYRGNVRIGGALYRLSGWRRESNGGKRWVSLAIQPDQRTEKPQATSAGAQTAQPATRDFDDDIPF